jgi:transcription initiation factor TFIIA large subunit
MGVAQFPWDPKPEPPPPANNPPPPAVTQPPPQAPTSYAQAQVNLGAPQNVPAQHQQQQHLQQQAQYQHQQQPLSLPGNPMQQQNSPQMQANYSPQIKSEPGLPRSDPPIKQEPGLANSGMPPVSQPGYATGPARGVSAVAQARAAQALENQYGQRAAASINALHNGIAQAPPTNQAQHYQGQPQNQVQQQGQRPGQPQQPQYQQQPHPQQQQQQQHQMNAQQAQAYRQQMAQQMAQQQQRTQQTQYANGQNGVHKSQVDGSSDAYEGILMQRDGDGNPIEMGRLEIDGYLHAQFAAKAKQMEGGGLMLPLKEATKHRSLAGKKKHAVAGPSQVDGLSDDEDDPVLKAEELDEDAINSDLDDPDDNQEEDDEDDDSMGHLMLCMYDKVQRVKNKWFVFLPFPYDTDLKC